MSRVVKGQTLYCSSDVFDSTGHRVGGWFHDDKEFFVIPPEMVQRDVLHDECLVGFLQGARDVGPLFKQEVRILQGPNPIVLVLGHAGETVWQSLHQILGLRWTGPGQVPFLTPIISNQFPLALHPAGMRPRQRRTVAAHLEEHRLSRFLVPGHR